MPTIIGKATLYNSDCMEYMATLPDKAFDICVTSPPYNMNLRVNQKGDGYCSRQIVKELSSKYINFSDNLPMGDYYKFIDNLLGELIRTNELVFFNIQLVTGNKPAVIKAIGNYSDNLKEVIIWDKGAGQPAICEGVLNSCFEFIYVFGSKSITRSFDVANFKRGTLDNIWRIKKEKSDDINHGASFPIKMVEKILLNFAAVNAKVFDPFLGTGTSAIACNNIGFEMVGCELDEDYFKSSCERATNALRQVRMFD